MNRKPTRSSDSNKKHICFLVSGNGGTLKFLYAVIEFFKLPLEISMIVADRNCGAYDFGIKKCIPSKRIKYNRNYTEELIDILTDNHFDVIVTNIKKILDDETLKTSKNSFINLHYSLLPAFAGLIGMETVKKAKEINSQFIGATCHEVILEVDAGKIIAQAAIIPKWQEPLDETIELVFRSACLIFLNAILLKCNIEVQSEFKHETDRFSNMSFSPALKFNPNILTENFWHSVKTI
jgi:phosphoribosylglycinamide formyltransferase-1